MMKTLCRRFAALTLAAIAIFTSGCAKKTDADATIIILTAPTVEPVVTPAPTPEATPAPQSTPRATKEPEDKREEAEDKPSGTEPPKEEKAASAKTPHAGDYTEVEIKKGSGSRVSAFEADRIDGGTLSQSYFSGGTITLVNMWSTT